MAQLISQAGRWLTLKSPLGEDVLVATELQGVEGISRLFEFSVSALSQRQTIEPQELLGKSVTLTMARPGCERRVVNGIVTSLSGGAVTLRGHRLFRLVMSPSLALLAHTSDYKVFQEKTAVEIAEEILAEAGVTFEKKLQTSYDKRDYCVQFGETDLAFLERLFAEEGIFYYFTHENDGHRLVIADHAAAYDDVAQPRVAFRQDVEDIADGIYQMDFGACLTGARWTLGDYDFEAPESRPEGTRVTNLQPASGKPWEHYRYPGGSAKPGTLTRLATVAADASDASFEEVKGQGTCASFMPGHRFTLSEHVVSSLENSVFVLKEVRHEAVDETNLTIRPDKESKSYYRNSFSCMPATRPARSLLPPPRSIVRGAQTALVVGPEGQEVHTDKFGRVRIQFPWDRYGTRNERSSCFVHVAQPIAGDGWGMMFLPRIGMEVVVHFLDGDPDRPLVTGAIYNGTNAPPWALQTDMTKSGILSRSTPSGTSANANELSFDDKKGEEMILLHAEKDFMREVENDDTLNVGRDQNRTIKNNRTTTINDGDETLTIKSGSRNVILNQGNDTLTLDAGDRTTTLTKGNDTLKILRGDSAIRAEAGKITIEAMRGITLKCGESAVEVTPQGVTVNGVQVSVNGAAKAQIKAPIVDASGDAMVILAGGMVKIN
jgi:type VI secretion system secreted protein VgrG